MILLRLPLKAPFETELFDTERLAFVRGQVKNYLIGIAEERPNAVEFAAEMEDGKWLVAVYEPTPEMEVVSLY